MPDQNKPADPLLAFAGSITQSKRLSRYATVSIADLPPEAAQKFKDYKNLLMGFAAALSLVLIHPRLWTLGMTVAIFVALWRFKSRYEAELDTLLAPFFKDGAGPAA